MAGDPSAGDRHSTAIQNAKDVDREILTEILAHMDATAAPGAAATILETCGTLRAALSASARAQERACGGDLRLVGILRSVRRAMLWTLRTEVESRPLLGNRRALVAYLRALIGFETHEHARLLHVNARLRLIRDETLARGGIDHVDLDVRDVVVRGLESGAHGIILVHNHPSGDATPSEADRVITRRLHSAAHTVGLRLLDHLIVTADGVFSFQSAGLL